MTEPSAREQLMLELINATRLDPFGHAATYISSYAPLTSPDPSVQIALDIFGVDGAMLLAAFQALTPAKPLAWNNSLSVATEAHSQAMITADQQSHQLPGEPSPSQRGTNAGYVGFSTYSENIFAFGQSELHTHAAFMVDWGGTPATGGMQNPPGHRNSIMNNNFREIGIGTIEENNGATTVGPLVMTQNFANRFALAGQAMILGVAFADADGDRFYDIGEGQGGVTVATVFFSATTASGGYSSVVGPGARTITLGGAQFSIDFVADENVKVDLVSGTLLKTSASLTLLGGATQVEAMGVTGLTLTAGAGNQALIGGGGGDGLRGGDGQDLLFGSLWSRTTGSGADVLEGGAGDDAIWGFDGDDNLQGSAGSDGLVGGAGADIMSGGDAADFLFGGDFSTVDGSRLADSGADTLSGGAGNDGLWGFDGADIIHGDAGDDYVEGEAGADVINGGAGADTIVAGADADTLNGGTDFDFLYGGTGADTFVFKFGDGGDWALDFSAAEGDKLRLENFGFASFAATPLVDLSTPGNPAVQLTVANGGGFDQLTVFGATLAQLNAGNVILA